MPGNECLARGSVTIDADPSGLREAKVYVRLEDTSRADASSRIVAEQTLSGADLGAGTPLQFELRGALPDRVSQCNLRVHVDVDGDGQVSPGDYVSTESYPVTRSTAQQVLQVRVRRV
jgi:putative lipoprotein